MRSARQRVGRESKAPSVESNHRTQTSRRYPKIVHVFFVPKDIVKTRVLYRIGPFSKLVRAWIQPPHRPAGLVPNHTFVIHSRQANPPLSRQIPFSKDR